MAKRESRNDTKAPKQAAPKISSLQISEPAPIVDPPPPVASTVATNDKMTEIIEGYEDGMMFVCTKETFDECMSLRLLGLPFAQMKVVKALQAEKSALFLFNMSDRRLHGLFHASSAGGANINRDAWNKGSSNSSPFPAQIEFVVARDCEPIHEKEFKHVFPDKHRIRKLDKTEVQKLVRLFLRDSKNTSAPAGAKRAPVPASSDKTIPKPAVPAPAKKDVGKADSKPVVAPVEKKSEPVAKAQPAFQWAAAPPKFAWGSKKPEKEEPTPPAVVEPPPVAPPVVPAVVEKPAVVPIVAEPAPVAEPEADFFVDAKSAVSKPNYSEDDLWGPLEPESKSQPSQPAVVVKQTPPPPQKLPAQQPVQQLPPPQLPPPIQAQPVQQAVQPPAIQAQQPFPQQTQAVMPPKMPQPISQHVQPQVFQSQLHQAPFQALQPNGFSHHGPGQLSNMHQPSLFPSALFPPPPSSQPLQMHFDDHWTQDTWGKDESLWGTAPPSNEGWNSWGRSFDSNLLFGPVANQVMDYAGEDLAGFEQEAIEYEEDLPHGPKCACCGCMPNLPPNLCSLLEYVGLSDCYPNFAAEQMDIEALSMCDDTHLHEMNFVVGARVKLGAVIRQLQKRNDLGGRAA